MSRITTLVNGTSTAADGRYHAVRWTVYAGVSSVEDLSGGTELSEADAGRPTRRSRERRQPRLR